MMIGMIEREMVAAVDDTMDEEIIGIDVVLTTTVEINRIKVYQPVLVQIEDPNLHQLDPQQ